MIAPDACRKQACIGGKVLVGANIQDQRRVGRPDKPRQLSNGNCVRRGHRRPLREQEFGRDISAEASRGNRDYPIAQKLPNAPTDVNDDTPPRATRSRSTKASRPRTPPASPARPVTQAPFGQSRQSTDAPPPVWPAPVQPRPDACRNTAGGTRNPRRPTPAPSRTGAPPNTPISPGWHGRYRARTFDQVDLQRRSHVRVPANCAAASNS